MQENFLMLLFVKAWVKNVFDDWIRKSQSVRNNSYLIREIIEKW